MYSAMREINLIGRVYDTKEQSGNLGSVKITKRCLTRWTSRKLDLHWCERRRGSVIDVVTHGITSGTAFCCTFTLRFVLDKER